MPPSHLKSLSVLIAVKNGASLLSRTLDSLFSEIERAQVIAQVIAIDDGSSDDSLSVLSRYPIEIGEIGEIAANSIPVGLAQARNLALEKASGEFIAFLDQDDIVVPGSFSRRIEFLERHPDFEAVAGEIASVIDEEGKTLGDFYQLSGKARGHFLLSWKLVEKTAEIPGALWLYLFRRKFLLSIGLFSSEWDELTDQEFLYRVLQKASIPHREIGVAHYRIHQKNSTVRWAGDRIGVNPRVKALGALLAMKYGLSPSWQAS